MIPVSLRAVANPESFWNLRKSPTNFRRAVSLTKCLSVVAKSLVGQVSGFLGSVPKRRVMEPVA